MGLGQQLELERAVAEAKQVDQGLESVQRYLATIFPPEIVDETNSKAVFTKYSSTFFPSPAKDASSNIITYKISVLPKDLEGILKSLPQPVDYKMEKDLTGGSYYSDEGLKKLYAENYERFEKISVRISVEFTLKIDELSKFLLAKQSLSQSSPSDTGHPLPKSPRGGST